MRRLGYIWILWLGFGFSTVHAQKTGDRQELVIDFYGDSLRLSTSTAIQVQTENRISHDAIVHFYKQLHNQPATASLVAGLDAYRQDKKLDDWLLYQLIRSTAEQISPKASNYHRYTLYKWLLLNELGFQAITRLRNDTLLLYVHSEEMIYDIPHFYQDGKQFVCLNYHDYGNNIQFDTGERFTQTALDFGGSQAFSYKISTLPDFKTEQYAVKELAFDYGSRDYNFKVLLNKQVKQLFNNYPVVDYASQFNIPLSRTTYNSLIPLLKDAVKGMSQKKGVDYLMHFTRSAFAFDTDTRAFGKEKRLSPEQTLLYDYSDCEDRSAFFFFLVKEIYQLPMIVLSYPTHITVAVQFDEPMGNPILYKGSQYWVCEPTPQKKDLKLGQLLPSLRKQAFEVVYQYSPK